MTLSAQEQIHTIYQGSKPKTRKKILQEYKHLDTMIDF